MYMGDVTGFHHTHSTQSSKVLFIDSKDATQRHNNETTHFTYVFRDSIIVQPNEGVLLSLLQASIPYSFYNVRKGVNDTIDILVLKDTLSPGSSLTQSEHAIVMEPGNYTAITLAQSFKEKLETVLNTEAVASYSNDPFTVTTRPAANVRVTIDYDRDTQKFKFQMFHNGDGQSDRGYVYVVFNLSHGQNKNTHFDVEIGFDSDTANQSVFFGVEEINNNDNTLNGQSKSGTVPINIFQGKPIVTLYRGDFQYSDTPFLVSDNIADLNGSVHALYLRTNLPVLSTMDSLTGSQSNIIAKIPINTGPGGIIFHEPRDSLHKSLIHTRAIKALEIRITDDRNRVVSLNGLHFSIALLLEFVSIRKNILPFDPRQTMPFGLKGDFMKFLHNKKIGNSNINGETNRTGKKRVHTSTSSKTPQKHSRRKNDVKSSK